MNILKSVEKRKRKSGGIRIDRRESLCLAHVKWGNWESGVGGLNS